MIETAAVYGVSHSPLLIQNREPGRHWTLNVQSTPKPALTFTGVEPTTDEIVRALTHTGAPAWLVPVVAVLAAVATKPTTEGNDHAHLQP